MPPKRAGTGSGGGTAAKRPRKQKKKTTESSSTSTSSKSKSESSSSTSQEQQPPIIDPDAEEEVDAAADGRAAAVGVDTERYEETDGYKLIHHNIRSGPFQYDKTVQGILTRRVHDQVDDNKPDGDAPIDRTQKEAPKKQTRVSLQVGITTLSGIEYGKQPVYGPKFTILEPGGRRFSFKELSSNSGSSLVGTCRRLWNRLCFDHKHGRGTSRIVYPNDDDGSFLIADKNGITYSADAMKWLLSDLNDPGFQPQSIVWLLTKIDQAINNVGASSKLLAARLCLLSLEFMFSILFNDIPKGIITAEAFIKANLIAVKYAYQALRGSIDYTSWKKTMNAFDLEPSMNPETDVFVVVPRMKPCQSFLRRYEREGFSFMRDVNDPTVRQLAYGMKLAYKQTIINNDTIDEYEYNWQAVLYPDTIPEDQREHLWNDTLLFLKFRDQVFAAKTQEKPTTFLSDFYVHGLQWSFDHNPFNIESECEDYWNVLRGMDLEALDSGYSETQPEFKEEIEKFKFMGLKPVEVEQNPEQQITEPPRGNVLDDESLEAPTEQQQPAEPQQDAPVFAEKFIEELSGMNFMDNPSSPVMGNSPASNIVEPVGGSAALGSPAQEDVEEAQRKEREAAEARRQDDYFDNDFDYPSPQAPSSPLMRMKNGSNIVDPAEDLSASDNPAQEGVGDQARREREEREAAEAQPQQGESEAAEAQPQQVNQDWYKIMSNEKYADVFLTSTDNTKIPSHRCILAEFSPIFAKIIDQALEIPIIINVEDFDAETIKAAMDFFIEKRDSIVGKEENVFKFAAKYRIQTIMEACRSYFEKSVNPSNVCEYIQIAYSNDFKELKQKCLEILVEKQKEIDASKFVDLPKNILFDFYKF